MTAVVSLALWAGLAGLFWRRLHWGLYALLAVLPFERIGSWALNPATHHPMVRLSQVVGAALVVAFATQIAAGRRRLIWSPWFSLLAGLVAWAVVPVIVIGYRPLWFGYAALVFVAVLVVVVANLVREVPPLALAAALGVGAVVTAAFGLFQFVAGALGAPGSLTQLRPEYSNAVFGFPRIQSTGLEPLYYANYLILPVLLAAALVIFRAGRRREWWLAGLMLGLGLTLVLTMSRGAFIGLAVAGVLVAGPLLVWQRRRVSLRVVGVAGAVAVVLALGLLAFASLRSGHGLLDAPKRFLSLVTVDVTRTGSYTEREQMRAQAATIVRSHPLMGVGIEGISPYVEHYVPGRSETTDIAFNNQFLELVAETGWPGAILFYGFLIWLAAAGALTYRRVRQPVVAAWLLALLAGLVAVTVQAQSFSGFLLTHLWVLYGLLAGFVLAYKDEEGQPRHG